ncbi:MAG: phosphoribosylformylglycinamidine cyclo-ligase [Acidobacteria bacterium]|nr:phosphoribosylformylglycinamidine cyclo-ligase [Acidobacteriota bacterium]
MRARRVTYAEAGVDRARADAVKRRIRTLARRTFTRGVLADIGSFGALYALDPERSGRWRDPVLVASTDSVGTKLKVAFQTNQHDTVGADLVNHCVNDIAVLGATPLFFLDYLASSKLEPRVLAEVAAGMSRACRAAGVALVGGETAELPGFYTRGEYDLVGFIVGVVERKQLLDGRRVRPGDVLLGLASNGLHTNGYALARKLLFEVAKLTPHSYVPELRSRLGRELLKVHRCYYPAMQPLLKRGWLTAAAHITGGGLTENVPRVLPQGLAAEIHLDRWRLPAIFGLLERLGRISQEEMLRTFNLGIGMVLMVPPRNLARVEASLRRRRMRFHRIGQVIRRRGRPRVLYRGQWQ